MRRLLVCGLLGILLGACGIPLQGEPEAIDIQLRSVGTPAVTDTLGPADGTIYLVRGGGLVAVDRELSTDPAALMALLFRGPTTAEEQGGLRSAIPQSSTVRTVEVTGRSAVVDVSRQFAEIGGEEEILAIAQIVLTLTVKSADRVSIELEGTPVAIPLPDGALATAPVGFSDYAALIEE